MRAALAIGVVGAMLAFAAPVRAEPLPPGSIGLVVAAASGTGADASRLGFGWQWGGAAAWQPMTTERRVGYSAKWSFVLGTMYDAEAASVGDKLLTLQMDLLVGIRIRPGSDPSRYITLRAGGELLRTSQVVPPVMQRAFAGAAASVGFEQYALGLLLDVDVRVSQIGSGPTFIAVMFGAGKTGP